MPSPDDRARKEAFPEQHHGLETLETFADTPHLNQWYFDELARPIRGEVLEIGSGIINMT